MSRKSSASLSVSAPISSDAFVAPLLACQSVDPPRSEAGRLGELQGYIRCRSVRLLMSVIKGERVVSIGVHFVAFRTHWAGRFGSMWVNAGDLDRCITTVDWPLAWADLHSLLTEGANDYRQDSDDTADRCGGPHLYLNGIEPESHGPSDALSCSWCSKRLIDRNRICCSSKIQVYHRDKITFRIMTVLAA